MKLIYVNEIGTDYKGQKQYEFIFSNSDEINVDDWLVIPASAALDPQTPQVSDIDMVGLLKDVEISFDLIQNSDFFGIIDAVDGIVSLAWEQFVFGSEKERLFFRFGETEESVNKKLKSRDCYLVKQEIKTDTNESRENY